MERKFADDKKFMMEKISEILAAKNYVIFAYIFGSFVSNENFRDIDIGIYVSGVDRSSYIDLELKLEGEIEDAVHKPTDVRVINDYSISFVYNVLKSGKVIVDKNELARCDFECLIFKKYFDFQFLRNEYLRGTKIA